MVYRHFGLKHVMSIMHHLYYEWEPLDGIEDQDLLAEGQLISMHKTLIFVDKYTLHYFGAARQDDVFMDLLPCKTGAGLIDHVLDVYPNREVQRVIFWFGTEYIVDYGNNDYGALVAFLSHHFDVYFGHPEQIVIAPPYIESHDANWTDNVLGLLVQKDILLPHARLIIEPHDLQLWRRIHFPTKAASLP